MSNNHMLAIIEQEMFSDDRKVWSRFLESTKSEATLEMLISWMTITYDQAFFFLRVKAKYRDLYLDRLNIGREGGYDRRLG